MCASVTVELQNGVWVQTAIESDPNCFVRLITDPAGGSPSFVCDEIDCDGQCNLETENGYDGEGNVIRITARCCCGGAG